MLQRREPYWVRLGAGLGSLSRIVRGGQFRVVMAAASSGLAVGVLIGFGIGRGQWRFLSHRYELKAYVSQPMGLHEGSQVMLIGIPVGTVTGMNVAPYPAVKPLEIRMGIESRYRDYIRADSVGEVARSGLLGDNYVEISRGGQRQPPLPPGGILRVREDTGIEDTAVWKRVRSLLTPGR